MYVNGCVAVLYMSGFIERTQMCNFHYVYSGLSYFSWHNLPKRGEIYQIATKLPNGHIIHQIAVVYFKQQRIYVPIFTIQRHLKMHTDSDIWFENMPSGNPGIDT
jgi:hypothetical protein